MVDRDAFDLRLAKLEDLLRDLRGLVARGRDAVLADHGLTAQLERWTHLLVECCIDLAHHVIASEGWTTPSTYRDAFRLLGEHGVIDPKLAEAMAGWAGLRNVLAHLYLDADSGRVFDAVRDEIGQVEAYAAALVRRVG